MLNLFMFLSFMMTLMGLYFDPSMTKKSYMLILFIFLMMMLMSIYMNKLPSELIKDLFWYSLLMFSSFMFHALWMKWIYDYCEKKDKNYMSFMISSISFMLSVSFMAYILNNIFKMMYEGSTSYKWKSDDDKYESFMVLEEHMMKKTEEIYEKYYTKSGIKLILLYGYLTMEYKIFSMINSILTMMMMMIQVCLGFFINNFNNYSMLLLGMKTEEKKEWKEYVKKGMMMCVYFVMTLMGAYVLGMPSSLYFMWMMMFIWTFLKECKELMKDPNTNTIKLLIKYFYYVMFKGEWWGTPSSLGLNQMKKFKGFDLVYGSKFNYNLQYFMYMKYSSSNLWTWRENFKLFRMLLDTPDLNNMTKMPYPMISYLKYYSNEELAKGEYEGATTFNAEYEWWMEQKWWPMSWWNTLMDVCDKFNMPEKDWKKMYKNLPKVKNDAEMRSLCTLENLENFKWMVKEQKFIYDGTEKSKI